MKWKAMLALFDGVLAACFLAIFLMPIAALGGGFFALFWRRNWPVAAVFLAVLAAVNAWVVGKPRPPLAARHTLAFGIPHLVAGDPAAAEAWFAARLDERGLRDRNWIRGDRAVCPGQLRRT